MELNFRKLKAEDILCRTDNVAGNGVSLLLYKDARVDQCILDETVTALGWQRKHPDNNSSHCVVSIYDTDKKLWIDKEDFGEIYNDSDKGLASDSFKRACFNWGIGRELYTAPFIWINSDKCRIEADPNREGKWLCLSEFIVSKIEYDAFRRISELEIINVGTRKAVFSWKREPLVVKPDEKPELKTTPKAAPKPEAKPEEEPKPKEVAPTPEKKTEVKETPAPVEKTEAKPEPKPEPAPVAKSEESAEPKTTDSTLPLNEALAMLAPIGKAKSRGWTLAETLSNNPVNLRWMYMQEETPEDSKEAIRVIVLNNPNVKTMFDDANIVF